MFEMDFDSLTPYSDGGKMVYVFCHLLDRELGIDENLYYTTDGKHAVLNYRGHENIEYTIIGAPGDVGGDEFSSVGLMADGTSVCFMVNNAKKKLHILVKPPEPHRQKTGALV